MHVTDHAVVLDRLISHWSKPPSQAAAHIRKKRRRQPRRWEKALICWADTLRINRMALACLAGKADMQRMIVPMKCIRYIAYAAMFANLGRLPNHFLHIASRTREPTPGE